MSRFNPRYHPRGAHGRFVKSGGPSRAQVVAKRERTARNTIDAIGAAYSPVSKTIAGVKGRAAIAQFAAATHPVVGTVLTASVVAGVLRSTKNARATYVHPKIEKKYGKAGLQKFIKHENRVDKGLGVIAAAGGITTFAVIAGSVATQGKGGGLYGKSKFARNITKRAAKKRGTAQRMAYGIGPGLKASKRARGGAYKITSMSGGKLRR